RWRPGWRARTRESPRRGPRRRPGRVRRRARPTARPEPGAGDRARPGRAAGRGGASPVASSLRGRDRRGRVASVDVRGGIARHGHGDEDGVVSPGPAQVQRRQLAVGRYRDVEVEDAVEGGAGTDPADPTDGVGSEWDGFVVRARHQREALDEAELPGAGGGVAQGDGHAEADLTTG